MKIVDELKKFTKKNQIILSGVFIVINFGFTLTNLALVAYSNGIAEKSLQANESSIGFQLDSRSQEYSSQAFDDIYEDEQNKETINLLKSNEEVTDSAHLKEIVDILEAAGSDFCQGTAKRRHLQIYLNKTLNIVCNNVQVKDTFSGQKNGLAMLCKEFSPDSTFASTVNMTNVHTCEFVDSWIFPKTQNRYRFEYK